MLFEIDTDPLIEEILREGDFPRKLGVEKRRRIVERYIAMAREIVSLV